MNFPLFIAKRYLFSKKSHNAINVISFISVCGIAVATMAMICMLSVFNGFGGLVEGMFNSFDPQLKITVKQGKVFNYHTPEFDKALSVEGVNIVSETLEDNALYKFGDNQVAVLLKGVSEEFKLITDMDKLLLDGKFLLNEDVVNYTILGSGIAMSLAASPDFVDPIEIYVPKRNSSVNMVNPASAFTIDYAFVSGVFSVNQPEYDEQMAIIPIALARKLFRYDNNEVSALELSLKEGASVEKVEKNIQDILGDSYLVENRFEQQKESFRMLQIEKWVTFLIFGLILLIAVFNVIGSLTMLIVEKKEDMMSLRNMGASDKQLTQIFKYEGWLICLTGIVVGIILGLIICLLQQHFGLLKLGSDPSVYIIDSYPVIVKFTDILIVFFVVTVVSFLTVLYPINNLKKKLKNI
ncbi:MAG: FtsX-like permease family protein [Dysgonamonadaceae bacterium]|nr:ABC transporter permease [Dysgonamonadaceae bacterium]MDD3901361.1 ABC transporter permease [Dysgonamonadaceae bacterium]MDD4399326.1 ABC transporter permease [Dysgonamonadaceae bacterium]MEA5080532.1 FtsX-like permease family protein [Dysgonamonadaceae bacterium]